MKLEGNVKCSYETCAQRKAATIPNKIRTKVPTCQKTLENHRESQNAARLGRLGTQITDLKHCECCRVLPSFSALTTQTLGCDWCDSAFSMFAVTYPNVYGKAPWGNLIRSSRSSFSIIQYPSLSNLSEDVWSIPKPCVQFRFQFRGSTKGQSFRKRLFRGWKERVDKAQHVLPKTF